MKIYNTMSRSKEELKPIKEGEVSIYVCGPTVYDYFHLGNARPFIVFDTFRRYLEYRGYKVNYVQNFTDIDDKMINRANDEGITVKELGDRFIAEYFVDTKGLGIKEATCHPRATECIDDIIALVSTLIEKGYAYEVDGDVYFDVLKYDAYGKLSKHNFDELKSGASERVTTEDKKKNAADFAVWKVAKPGEPSWESPWGLGRPGWHIECSAMAKKCIGDTVDIHCGGQDLVFPHHENEIAQSEAANGKPFVNYWMHNGFINIDGEKMSKSLGNFFTIREIVKLFGYDVIRFFILSSHYRSPINFADVLLKQAQNGLERIYTCINNLEFLLTVDNDKVGINIADDLGKYREKFIQAMDDDMNTANAIAAIFEAITEINSNVKADSKASHQDIKAALDFIKELCDVLGIAQKEEKGLDDEIQALIEKRQQARKDRDFQLADKIRDDLKAQGIILEDTPNGVKWRRE